MTLIVIKIKCILIYLIHLHKYLFNKLTRTYPTINKKSFTSAFRQYEHRTFSQRGKIQMDDPVSIVNPQYGPLLSAGLNISEY